jgi:hypothetical protein
LSSFSVDANATGQHDREGHIDSKYFGSLTSIATARPTQKDPIRLYAGEAREPMNQDLHFDDATLVGKCDMLLIKFGLEIVFLRPRKA